MTHPVLLRISASLARLHGRRHCRNDEPALLARHFLAFLSKLQRRVSTGQALIYRRRHEHVLTTCLILPRAVRGPPSVDLQSSTRYGLDMITASATMMFVPSQRVVNVLLIASKIFWASAVTPLPRRASSALALVRLFSRRA